MLLSQKEDKKKTEGGIQLSPAQTKPGLFSAFSAQLPGYLPEDVNPDNDTVESAVTYKPRFEVITLSLAVFISLLILFIWAGFAEIDEVTHADGTVIGSQRTQSVQNLEGGILRTLYVREGQVVEKDALLAQLDNVQAKASYRETVNKTIENIFAILCLEAELNQTDPVFPKDLNLWLARIIGHYPDKKIIERAEQILADERNASVSRRNQLHSELQVLVAQLEQRSMEVKEQKIKKEQIEQSLALAQRQRDMAYNLVQRKNFSQMEFIEMEQKVVDLKGQLSQLEFSIPKTESALLESKQRISSRTAEWKKNISDDINKRRIELTSLKENLSAGGDQVTRTEIRSPVRGTVKQIYINTIGGIVRPGDSIMDIVPLDDTLLVEARVVPKDVAFLHPGQDVIIKISAYDFNIYGGLEGKLESISADTIEDKHGEFYYTIKIRTPRTHIFYHNDILPIIPGMMVTTDILIGKKTILDYILYPIQKAQENALRER